jgi:hypothetical protein
VSANAGKSASTREREKGTQRFIEGARSFTEEEEEKREESCVPASPSLFSVELCVSSVSLCVISLPTPQAQAIVTR